MFEHYQIRFKERRKEHQVLSAILTLAAAILTFVYPNFLYIIAGGYLIALGIFFLISKMPTPIIALPIIAGIFIMLFPNFIPYTFAGFLILFGAVFFPFIRTLGILAILIAVIILLNPQTVAIFIALFMLIYAVSDLIGFYKSRQQRKAEYENWEEVE